MKPSLIFFDLETSGLDPEENEIIQIAALAEGPSGEILGRFNRKVEFDLDLADDQALEINHYDESVWEKEAISRENLCRDFYAFLQPYRSLTRYARLGKPYQVCQLVGYNSEKFDIAFLNNHFKEFAKFLPCDLRTLDVMQLALWTGYRKQWDIANYKLATVAAYLGISVPGDLHDAEVDVVLTRLIMHKLLEEQE